MSLFIYVIIGKMVQSLARWGALVVSYHMHWQRNLSTGLQLQSLASLREGRVTETYVCYRNAYNGSEKYRTTPDKTFIPEETVVVAGKKKLSPSLPGKQCPNLLRDKF